MLDSGEDLMEHKECTNQIGQKNHEKDGTNYKNKGVQND